MGGIIAEYGGVSVIGWVAEISQMCWELRVVSCDWRDALIVALCETRETKLTAKAVEE